MQAATSAAAKHMNNSLVNQAIAAMYQHPQLHDHVVGWAPPVDAFRQLHPQAREFTHTATSGSS